jgi:diguanylate cyclase (GGDEF)-like protein
VVQGKGYSSISGNSRRRGLSLGFHLGTLLLVAIVPAMVAIALSLWHSGSSLRDGSRQVLSQGSHAVAMAVGGELRSNGDLLRTIATSERDEAELAALARRYNQNRDDRNGQLLIIDEAGTAAREAGISEEVLQQARTLGRAVVTDLFTAPKTGALQFAVVVPSQTGSSESAMLALLLTPDKISEALIHRDSDLQSILVAVTDGQGRIIARSRDSERFVGKRAPDWDRLTALGTSSGSFRAKTADGASIIFAFEQLDGTPGWSVVVGEPEVRFNARWQGPLKNLFWASGTALLIALLGSFAAARLILRPIAALVERSRKIANDEPGAAMAVVPRSTVSEFEELRLGLDKAEKALRERADAERRAADEIAIRESRYRALAEVGALAIWRRARDGQLLASDGWGDFTTDSYHPGMSDWFKDVFAEDQPGVFESWRNAVATQGIVDHEFRIRAASGEWHWVRARGAPVSGQGNEVAEWIGVLEDVHERREAQARISHMAYHDALTALANRSAFAEALTKAIAARKAGQIGAAILCIDLDRFKEINDTLGHAAGDKLLLSVTDRLKANVKKGDVVARLGGDEFVVLQGGGTQPAAASALAARLISKLSEPYDIDGQRAVIGASIGITLVDADTTAEQLMQQGDLALYRAKSRGRQQFIFFEPEMDVRMQERRRQELDLRRGMAADEFSLVYQPIFEADGRTLVGFEALLRWNHPQRGVLLPKDFLSLAEELSLVLALGRTALRQACSDAASWPDPLRVAVNISPVQLARSDFVEMVLSCLTEFGLDARRLELEISESALARVSEQVLDTLRMLKQAGIRIVMDHFGTSYASIGNLWQLPVDKVKIDRRIVEGLDKFDTNDAIVGAITRLCESIGVSVGVQGVETRDQFKILSRYASTEIQGFLWGSHHEDLESFWTEQKR